MVSTKNINIIMLSIKGNICANNKLTSLFGGPTHCGEFDCRNNQLTSLKGGPEIVRGDFNCSHNKLESLEGCPKRVDGDFICYNNPAHFTEKYIRSLCNIRGKIISSVI